MYDSCITFSSVLVPHLLQKKGNLEMLSLCDASIHACRGPARWILHWCSGSCKSPKVSIIIEQVSRGYCFYRLPPIADNFGVDDIFWWWIIWIICGRHLKMITDPTDYYWDGSSRVALGLSGSTDRLVLV